MEWATLRHTGARSQLHQENTDRVEMDGFLNGCEDYTAHWTVDALRNEL